MRIALYIVSRMLWLLALASAGLGAVNFFMTYGNELLLRQSPDMSAPQLAALAGSSLAFAAIPYVIARAWDELIRPKSQD
jgi:hypothetical protein